MTPPCRLASPTIYIETAARVRPILAESISVRLSGSKLRRSSVFCMSSLVKARYTGNTVPLVHRSVRLIMALLPCFPCRPTPQPPFVFIFLRSRPWFRSRGAHISGVYSPGPDSDMYAWKGAKSWVLGSPPPPVVAWRWREARLRPATHRSPTTLGSMRSKEGDLLCLSWKFTNRSYMRGIEYAHSCFYFNYYKSILLSRSVLQSQPNFWVSSYCARVDVLSDFSLYSSFCRRLFVERVVCSIIHVSTTTVFISVLCE